MNQLTLSCPRCAQPVSEGDRFCEGCGIDLRNTAPAPTAAPTPPQSPPAAPPFAAPAAPPQAAAPFGAPPAPPQATPPSAPQAAPPAPAPAAPPFAAPPAPVPAAAPFGAPAPPPQAPAGEAAVPADPRAGLVVGGSPAPAHVPGATGDFVLAAPARLLISEAEDAWDQAGAEAGAAAGSGTGPEADPVDHEPTEVVPVIDPDAGRVCVGCGARTIDADGYCESCGRSQPRPRDHQERALAGVCGVSDRGHRHHRNEDAFAVAATSRPGGVPAVVAVVCDGVSSATRPDEASQAAADIASEHLLESLESGAEPKAAMHAAIMVAAERVERLASEGPLESSRNSPACTIVSAVASEGEVTVGWVGDSRAYWFPDDRSGSLRLTLDDSWAARMVEAGLMSEAEAYADPRAHAITGWLGADAVEVEPHTTVFTPTVPGVILVCTDGLWNYEESAAALAAVVPADARVRPLEAAQDLVRFACERGGHDNITVAVLPCLPGPTAAPVPTGPAIARPQPQEG